MRKMDRNMGIKNKVPKMGKFKPRWAKRMDIAEGISHLAGNFSTCPICDEPLVARKKKEALRHVLQEMKIMVIQVRKDIDGFLDYINEHIQEAERDIENGDNEKKK